MPPPVRDPRVFKAQLEIVFRLSEPSLLTAFAFSTILVLFYFELAQARSSLLWWLLVNASGASRIYLGRAFRKDAFPAWTLDRWAAIATIGPLISGLLWSYFIIVLAPPWGDVAYPIAIFMAAGIPAVSLASNSAVFSAYVTLATSLILPFSLNLILWSGRSSSEVIGGFASLLYLAFLLVVGRAINLLVVDTLDLKFRNDDLVDRLSASNQELAGEVARREETENGLREATAAAEAANRAKSTFLARMSHEIRTPLNGILGMGELLLQTPLDDQQTRQAETINEAGQSLLRMVNDILDLSKIEAGKLSLTDSDFAISEAIDRVIALLKPRADLKGLRLEVEIARDVPAGLRGDPLRLRQILINLVGNATKFTERGFVRVNVWKIPSPPGDAKIRLRFEVTDTGSGIDPRAKTLLFEPFADIAVENREAIGSGLGLSICQQLAELMGGEIGVESTLGAGSVFWFTATFAPALGRVVISSPRKPHGLPAPQLRGHVLVADDNQVNRVITGEFLRRLGCGYEEAGDGREALVLALSGRFDLALIDGEMPRMTGYAVATQVRARENSDSSIPRLTLIAVTAGALPTDRERAISAGMDAYLAKPFSMMDLYRTISPFLPLAHATSDAVRPTPR